MAAYLAALEVYTRAAHPVRWAITQNNLGNALADQGALTEGPAGAALLAGAAAAYRAALEVHTRAARPVDWAMTQENLGLVFEDDGGPGPGRRRSGRVVQGGARCFDAALEVFGPVVMEPNRAKCARNRARVAGKLGVGPSGVGGIMSTTEGRVHLAPGVPM